MDDADDATLKEERQLNLIFRYRKTKPLDMSNPDRRCFQCGAETESPVHRWCSTICRDVWAEENEG